MDSIGSKRLSETDGDAWTNARLRALIEARVGVRFSRVYIWQIATKLGLGHRLPKSRQLVLCLPSAFQQGICGRSRVLGGHLLPRSLRLNALIEFTVVFLHARVSGRSDAIDAVSDLVGGVDMLVAGKLGSGESAESDYRIYTRRRVSSWYGEWRLVDCDISAQRGAS
jgi:hypothetical protein